MGGDPETGPGVQGGPEAAPGVGGGPSGGPGPSGGAAPLPAGAWRSLSGLGAPARRPGSGEFPPSAEAARGGPARSQESG